MTTLTRTTSENIDFQMLTALFDEYLVEIDGEEKDFFAQFNQIYLEYVVVCYENGIAVGCGAFKKLEKNQIEIKRMFVHPNYRNIGIANLVLSELEIWAKQLGNTSCILETSFKLESAIALYKKSGFKIISNYGQYKGVESSVCMKKILK